MNGDDWIMRDKVAMKKSNSSTPTCQEFIFVVIFVILNLILFFGFGTSDKSLRCPTDTVLQFTTLFLAKSGLEPLRDVFPESCIRPVENTEKELASAMQQLVKDCRSKRAADANTDFRRPLLTLFTTHASHSHNDAEKDTVHNNTLVNWASFKPLVNILLFSNESKWLKVAGQHGWDAVSTESKIFSDPPVLRQMFLIAKEKYDTPWYGYINADILFTSDLIKTLKFLSITFPLNTSRVLVTGRRTNVNNLTLVNISSDETIRRTARTFGSLYREDAEDYFITSKAFPWAAILPVVVGRPGYDNWLVAEAWCNLDTAVIDVTETNLVLHQTTQKGGNSEGHTHNSSKYNFDLFKHNNVTPNYLAGLTSCTPFRTFTDFCGSVNIEKRSERGLACKCPKKS